MLLQTIKLWLLRRGRKSNQGFSLTEILVGTVISLIVITALLTAMIEIMKRDRKEGILSRTQQDMERALKYIANDLKESVYVYDFTQSATGSSAYTAADSTRYPLPNLPDFGAGVTPVLAFWKLVPVNETLLNALDCTTYSNTSYIPEAGTNTSAEVSLKGECIALQNRRKMYSLVVYLQEVNTSTVPNGRGKSRILRYELPKYNPNGPLSTRTTGFIDPSYTSNFTKWPRSSSGTNIQATLPIATANSNPAVLVDFVDAPNNTAIDTNLPTCNTNVNAALTIGTTTFPTETRIPPDPATSNSFFVCVRTTTIASGQTQGVKIYLRGNAYGQAGLSDIIEPNSPDPYNPDPSNTVLSPLQTRVTLRGVIDKSN